MPTSIALGKHFEVFVKDQIANGRYNSVSEVVRDALRLLEDREQDRQIRLEGLRSDIDEGLKGPFSPTKAVFARVREKITNAARSTDSD